MTAARDLELFETLKDARPKHARLAQPAAAQRFITATPALRATRFSVDLPKLGGAVELVPGFGFEPVLCKRCGAPRPTEQYQPRTVTVLPCTSCPIDLKQGAV